MAKIRIGRPPHRRERLVAELRRRILRGELPPGGRLPSRLALTREFNTAIPTVQDAVQCLIRDGFVETKGTRGAYVAAHPPHLCTYGLVLPGLYDGTRFFDALRKAARLVFDSESRRLRLYEPRSSNPEDPDARQVIDDVMNHRLAGVIITWWVPDDNGSTIYGRNCNTPRVMIGNGGGEDYSPPSLVLDMPVFFERAVDRLVERGRRRIAHVGLGENSRPLLEHLAPILRRRGVEYRPYWHQKLGGTHLAGAHAATHLLMSLAPADRPDGLIISDDNLVEHVQAGLVDAGVRVPQELDVIAHCNWPEPPMAVLPITLLGFDGIGIMRLCARLIDEQRGGQIISRLVRFEPQFEEELAGV